MESSLGIFEKNIPKMDGLHYFYIQARGLVTHLYR